MKKIEAKTLEEAYAKAAETFNCSVTDLDYEIVQHPSSGFLGIGAKNAIIVAAYTRHREKHSPSQNTSNHSFSSSTKKGDSNSQTHANISQTPPSEIDNNSSSGRSHSIPPAPASETEILSNFFDESHPDSTHSSADKEPATQTDTEHPAYTEDELGHLIEKDLGILIRSTCFDIDTVEVDVIDNTAYIFIDGEDAALLIGKEGYRYNALSYLLYNWLHNEYGLFIKLEIAQFLASQQEMIRNYIQPVIEHVRLHGWGKTRPLDGILVQIALEQLREEFPDKYVAIKRTRNKERYILINEFNKRP